MAKKKPVVFTFGRFQPPTTGHEKLIKRVIDHAEEIGGEHRIYTSQSSDANRPRAEIKDPLEYDIKVKFLKKMFPYANIVKGGEDIATFMRVLYDLDKKGYKVVHMIVGDDRVADINKTVKQYLGGDDPETALNFDEFKVISAGKRDPDAAGVEGMSGSKLRAAVKADDFKLFKKGMPSGFSDARGLFDALKKGMEPMKKGKKIEEAISQINEVTPPDEKSERFVKKAKASFKDRYGDDWASYLYGVAWKQYNKRHDRPTKTRLGEPIEVEEETLQEGGVKGALEDFMYSIPKEAIEELKPVMQVKNLTKRFAMITKVLKKHGFTQRFMGSMPANVVNDYYPTFFGESVEQIDELTIPRKAEVVDRNKEEKTVTLKWADFDGWHEVEVPEDEVPGFYDRAAEPLKARKTDRFGNIMNPPKKGAEKKTEKAAVANVKNAEEILDIFDRKPMKTEITVYGKKWGKPDEYEMVIMKRMYQGEEVFVVKSSGRFVELRPTGAGLQVIDTKTKRILLDKGNDATW